MSWTGEVSGIHQGMKFVNHINSRLSGRRVAQNGINNYIPKNLNGFASLKCWFDFPLYVALFDKSSFITLPFHLSQIPLHQPKKYLELMRFQSNKQDFSGQKPTSSV